MWLYYIYAPLYLHNLTGGGVDYDSGPNTVTFSAGEESISFGISINDDNIFEHNENFALAINASSLPSGVYVGNHSETIVTIVDNDGK